MAVHTRASFFSLAINRERWATDLGNLILMEICLPVMVLLLPSLDH